VFTISCGLVISNVPVAVNCRLTIWLLCQPPDAFTTLTTRAVSLDCIGERHFEDPKQAVSGNGGNEVTYNANSPPTKPRPWVAIRASSLELRYLSVSNAHHLSAHIRNDITPLTTSRALCIPCATLLRRQLKVYWRGSGRHWCCSELE
jgi:hypothetical protein